MKISVVLACHNGSKYIVEQLSSILGGTRLPDEVIICDDMSSDNTVELCRNFINENGLTSWKVFENKKNLGFCLNFFRAMEKATGDIIFLCDQDDIWLPEKCEKMAAVMEENEDILSLACRYDIIDANGAPLPRSSVRYAEFNETEKITDIPFCSLIGCSWIRGFSMCYKKSIAPYLKPMDLKDLLAHDWLINAVASGMGHACFINEVLNKYRSHGSNASLSAKRSRQRRCDGLEQSINAHEYLLQCDLKNLTARDKKDLQKQIKFETKRLHAVKNRSLITWMLLFFSPKCYKRYYKDRFSGLRVWLGDLMYIIRK